jgi:hypothetical protein
MTAFYGWVCNDPWYTNGLNCVGGWSAASCGSYYPYICKIPYTSFKCMPPPRYARALVSASTPACCRLRCHCSNHMIGRCPRPGGHAELTLAAFAAVCSPPPPPPAPPSPPAPPLPPICEPMVHHWSCARPGHWRRWLFCNSGVGCPCMLSQARRLCRMPSMLSATKTAPGATSTAAKPTPRVSPTRA